MPATDQDEMKARVAARALDFVRDGMALGLGTGTTAKFFVDGLAARVREGLTITCVPTSEATRIQAEGLGIRTTTLDEVPTLDLTIDGADEFDPELRLIKGGGGALLREKIVAAASKALLVIADPSKEVERLGRFPLPVEINRFGLGSTRRLVAEAAAALGLSGPMDLRRQKGSDEILITDGGHLILDCHFGSIPDPEALSSRLFAVPGVVEHGLFIGLAKAAIVADGTGTRIVGTLSP